MPWVLFRTAQDIAGGWRVSPIRDQSVAASPEQAQALWYVAPGKAEIRSEPVAVLPAGHVRVRAMLSALSRGTERLVFAGRVSEREFERMRALFMGGSFSIPYTSGYAIAGLIG